MPQHETIYSFIEAQFRALNVPEYSLSRLVLDAEAEGYGDVYEIPTLALVNAMRARGLDVRNGIIGLPAVDGEHFDPIATSFERFVSAARTILRDAEQPIPAHRLIAQVNLPAAAVPYAGMADYLKEVGIYHIPGVGYWRAPQWTMPDGRMISKRIHSERTIRLRDLFEQIGWPIVGREAEAMTDGLVSSVWLSNYAGSGGIALGLGIGLFVPRDVLTKDRPLPMSANVAQAFADLDDDAVINDKDHFRLFRVALKAAALGYLTVRKSRTTKGGKRVQTMRLTWTEEGLVQLRKAIHRTADVF